MGFTPNGVRTGSQSQLNMKPFVDYHVHPGYSIDAQDATIQEYCRKALSIGLDAICFTPHLEVDPVRRHLDWFVRVNGTRQPMDEFQWLNRYFEDIENARDTFGPQGLTIKAGIEVGFDRGLEKRIEHVLDSYPFDFILGSVHCIEHQAISSWRESREYFPGRDMYQVVKEYFLTLSEAVGSELFHCMGHLDLYCRYGINYYGQAIMSAHRGLVEPILAKMAKRGIGLEVNTSSIRRGLHQFHPSREILEQAVKAGVTVFTVGSDAHKPEDLGFKTQEAINLLAELGAGHLGY